MTGRQLENVTVGRPGPGDPSQLQVTGEGVFVEPASAASIAGLLKSIDDGWVKRGSTVVCTVTGNGLKDPDTALKDMPTVTPVRAHQG